MNDADQQRQDKCEEITSDRVWKYQCSNSNDPVDKRESRCEAIKSQES
jgi:hypothetical protein